MRELIVLVGLKIYKLVFSGVNAQIKASHFGRGGTVGDGEGINAECIIYPPSQSRVARQLSRSESLPFVRSSPRQIKI